MTPDGNPHSAEGRVRCYLFDIDGTIADLSHRLHHITCEPKDWRSFFAACRADQPIPHMMELVHHLNALAPIVFVSGRSTECRDDTLAWLMEQGFQHVTLYQRSEGDHRPDDRVKGELLDMILADGWQPIMAFDDRTQVVKMWRARGIPCAQVAEGDF